MFTISRGFRLNHLNGSSDSIGSWENTNTRSQKDLVNVCFSICVWKPEPKVSKTNKHKDNFHTIFVWLSVMIYLKIIHFNNFHTFGLHVVAFLRHPVFRGTFQSQQTHVRIWSKIMFLWCVKLRTLYGIGRTRTPPAFNSWTSVAPMFHFWSCCWELILFHLSVESWFICRCFDSLISRSPSREPNNSYVYEAQQNLGRGLLQRETCLSPQ